MQPSLLTDFVIIFGLGIGVIFICHRLRIPTVVGLLLTGVLAGPHGLGFVQAVHGVEVLAEIGVILLLFTIGIEFSLAHLLRIKTIALVGGTLQMAFTVLAGALIAIGVGRALGEAVFMGFLLALSSTAVVLKLIQQRAEVASPHGRIAVGVLIFQDIAVVPMMILTPMLAGMTTNMGSSLLELLLKGVALIAIVIACVRWVVPKVLYYVAETRDRELFMLSITFIGLAIAWLTASVELSLALGAFLAGLIISESEYSQRALGSILPFRDVFTSLFFVSVGMLLDVNVMISKPGTILLLTLGVIGLKFLGVGLATYLLGFPLRTVVLVGFSLSQVGEFSFILSKTGIDYGFLSGELYQLFLAVSVLTMIATPFMTMLGHQVAKLVVKWPLPRLKIGPRSQIESLREKDWSNHLVMIGFGETGKNVVHAAAKANISYLIIEMNPQTIREARAQGEPIYYGDATHEAVLEHVDIHRARVVVVAISDAAAARRVITAVHHLNPTVQLIVRTQFINEIPALLKLGAHVVIPDEFEASIQIFTRVLKNYLVPRAEIEKFVSEVRADGYHFLRDPDVEEDVPDWTKHLSETEINTLQINPCSPLIGKSLAEAALRNIYEVTILAIQRHDQTITNPSAETRLQIDDVLIVMGQPDKIVKVAVLCDES